MCNINSRLRRGRLGAGGVWRAYDGDNRRGGTQMNAETKTQVSSEAFHQRLHANHMYGLWELASQMTAHPQPKVKAHLWKWSLFESILEQSGEVVPIGDERRALQLFNPGLDGRGATTNSLLGAIQMLLRSE